MANFTHQQPFSKNPAAYLPRDRGHLREIVLQPFEKGFVRHAQQEHAKPSLQNLKGGNHVKP